MSDPTYQTKIYGRGGGSVLTIDSAGTLQVLSGGSIRLASGAILNVDSGGSIVYPSGAALNADRAVIGTLTLGGTVGRWAFGTAALTSGVGTIATGLGRVISATGNPILGEAPGLGSFTTLMIDLSLSASGSVIFHAGAGTLPYSNNGTVAWMAYGT